MVRLPGTVASSEEVGGGSHIQSPRLLFNRQSSHNLLLHILPVVFKVAEVRLGVSQIFVQSSLGGDAVEVGSGECHRGGCSLYGDEADPGILLGDGVAGHQGRNEARHLQKIPFFVEGTTDVVVCIGGGLADIDEEDDVEDEVEVSEGGRGRRGGGGGHRCSCCGCGPRGGGHRCGWSQGGVRNRREG